jgi:hypothetical protein
MHFVMSMNGNYCALLTKLLSLENIRMQLSQPDNFFYTTLFSEHKRFELHIMQVFMWSDKNQY